jgi:hypothetical protein
MRRNVPRVMKRASRLVAEYIPQGDTSMLRLVRMLGWVAAMIIAVFVAGTTSASDSPLTKLATAKFPNLTHAERAMLQFADAGNIERGEIAIGGSNSDPVDPSNDPRQVEKWSHERDIRASLLMWLCDDPAATPLINRAGIKILGARIVGVLDLSRVRVPFALTMRKCSFAERLVLVQTEIPHLNLDGSYTTEINAEGLIVRGDLNLGEGFHASGETRLERAKIDGALICSGGSFHYSKLSMSRYAGNDKPALILDEIVVGSEVDLDFGFRSEGAVTMRQASVAHDLGFYGAHLINPHNWAFEGNFSNYGSVWFGNPPTGSWGTFEADGLVDFTGAKITNSIIVSNARFLGAPGDGHGFSGGALTAGGYFYWRDVELKNGATVDLSGAHVGILLDEEKSWPEPSYLLIDGFTYDGFGPGSPTDLRTRLRWISLQPQTPGAFNPQPYRQLARAYRESGLENDATSVLIAAEDVRYARYGWRGRLLGGILRATIGYGHRPLRAIDWSLGVVLLGWLMVSVAKRAGVMRLTWPETTPPPSGDPTAGLNPLLYSLDVFLPFVNLHQEHYWWPDESRAGSRSLAGMTLKVRGSVLRSYLWMQIIAGWLLSAIFIAGVTGLLRND